jgi:hypothetical protein
LVDGNPRGSGEDQHMEQVRNLHLLTASVQRQVSQGVDGEIEDVLALQGILRHTHRDSPNERVKGFCFSFVIGIPVFFEDLSVYMGIFNY